MIGPNMIYNNLALTLSFFCREREVQGKWGKYLSIVTVHEFYSFTVKFLRI